MYFNGLGRGLLILAIAAAIIVAVISSTITYFIIS